MSLLESAIRAQQSGQCLVAVATHVNDGVHDSVSGRCRKCILVGTVGYNKCRGGKAVCVRTGLVAVPVRNQRSWKKNCPLNSDLETS